MTEASIYIILNDITSPAGIFNSQEDVQSTLTAIAEAIALDPRWSDINNPNIIIRSDPSPQLAVIGYFDKAHQARIQSLTYLLTQQLQRLRHVDYQQAEQDCEILATKLIDQVGKDALKDYRFVGVPRGGLIVLGMLAYCLGLKPDQLTPDANAPLVVVDDCSISGARFGQFLSTLPNQQVIFAPLYAHPDLRDTIMTRETRVEACICAHDLHDYAPEQYGDDYPAWLERWQIRSGDRRYWTGIPEHVTFAWNEPDNSIWNPVTETEEIGWRIIPDAYCLKNRVQHRQPVANIQHQPIAQGSVQPTESVIFGELDDQIIVANIQSGINLSLSDVGADMWRAVIHSSDLDCAVQSLLNTYDIDETTLKNDLNEFVQAMQQYGLLTE